MNTKFKAFKHFLGLFHGFEALQNKIPSPPHKFFQVYIQPLITITPQHTFLFFQVAKRMQLMWKLNENMTE